MSVDVLLDLVTGDLPTFNRFGDGIDVVRQRLQIRLGTFLGEWILDQSKGLPFLVWFQQKPPLTEAIGAFIRREIETTPGVLQITEFTSDFNGSRLLFTGEILFDGGESEAINVTVDPTDPENSIAMISFMTQGGILS